MWFTSAQSAASVNAIANTALIVLGLLTVLSTAIAIASNSVMQRYADGEIARARADAEEARADSAKANQRTAELQLETEVLREKVAWRRLTQDQVFSIGQSLQGIPFSIVVADLQGDPESTTYGEDISAALKRAGIRTKQEDLVYAGGPPFVGVHVTLTPDGNGDKVAAALTDTGIVVTGRPNSDSVVISVGTKPRPF